MSQVVESVCPLSNSPAKVERHIAAHSAHFICLTCGEIIIKQRAEAHILKSSDAVRNTFAQAAKQTPEDKVIFIYCSPVSDPGPPTCGWEYLSRDEALGR